MHYPADFLKLFLLILKPGLHSAHYNVAFTNFGTKVCYISMVVDVKNINLSTPPIDCFYQDTTATHGSYVMSEDNYLSCFNVVFALILSKDISVIVM